jgi:hypothetical protein
MFTAIIDYLRKVPFYLKAIAKPRLAWPSNIENKTA